MKMKALKTFMGGQGESNRPDGLVMAGDEFETTDARARALELQRPQIAVPAGAARKASAKQSAQAKVKATQSKGETPNGPAPAETRAATGPLGTGRKAGGKTGLTRPQRSSVVVRQPKASRSKPKGDAA
jgi:hypothetical protein